MAISLKKGQGVNLKKSENELSEVTIGLGWDVNDERRRRFLWETAWQETRRI